jgi:hypothetical protein
LAASCSARSAGGEPRPNEQALGIDQHMALAPIDLLPTVIPPRAARHGGIDRLFVDDSRRWLGITSHLYADGGMQGNVKAGPDAPHTPEATIPVMGHQAPGTATSEYIENRVQDFAHRMPSKPTSRLWGWQVRCERTPFSVRLICQICRIRFSGHSPSEVPI